MERQAATHEEAVSIDLVVGRAADITGIPGIGAAREWLLVPATNELDANAEKRAARCLLDNPACTAFVHQYEIAAAAVGNKRRAAALVHVYAMYAG